ncbi:MAG: SAF domain-containing protein [Kiloniellaceae bacterium]
MLLQGAIQGADLVALRPSGGIPPAELGAVDGRKAARPLCAGDMLRWQDLA